MTEEKEEGSPEELRGLWTMLRVVSSLGFAVTFGITLFLGLGYLLDKYFGTGAAGMALCGVAGFLISLYWAYRRVSRILGKIMPREGTEDEREPK